MPHYPGPCRNGIEGLFPRAYQVHHVHILNPSEILGVRGAKYIGHEGRTLDWMPVIQYVPTHVHLIFFSWMLKAETRISKSVCTSTTNESKIQALLISRISRHNTYIYSIFTLTQIGVILILVSR